MRVSVNLVSPIYSCYSETLRIKRLDGLCISGIEKPHCFDAKSNCCELTKKREVIKLKSQFEVKYFRAIYLTIRCKTKANHDLVYRIQFSRARQLSLSASSSHWFNVLLILVGTSHNCFFFSFEKRPDKASRY